MDKIKYPLRSSYDIQQATLGKQQQTNALLFLNSSPSVERIASEIRNAVDAGRIDFAWTLLESSRPGIPVDRTFSDEEQKRVALLNEIESGLPEHSKLDELKNELQSIMGMAQTAREMQKHFESGSDNEFFTREEVEHMPQVQVTANLQAVNESMSCWEDRQQVA